MSLWIILSVILDYMILYSVGVAAPAGGGTRPAGCQIPAQLNTHRMIRHWSHTRWSNTAVQPLGLQHVGLHWSQIENFFYVFQSVLAALQLCRWFKEPLAMWMLCSGVREHRSSSSVEACVSQKSSLFILHLLPQQWIPNRTNKGFFSFSHWFYFYPKPLPDASSKRLPHGTRIKSQRETVTVWVTIYSLK